MKAVYGATSRYQCPRARDEQSGAVAERAHRCAGEYLRAAREADRQYSAAGTNPILDRLRSFGQTRGRECLSTCRTPTSSSTRPARGAWPTARKRARTPRVP